jgi:hypothetical protein
VNKIETWCLMLAALALAGCAHMKKVYVPNRCIQRVKWSQPCEAISESLIKCDGVMLTVSCVSAAGEAGGKMERKKFGE